MSREEAQILWDMRTNENIRAHKSTLEVILILIPVMFKAIFLQNIRMSV